MHSFTISAVIHVPSLQTRQEHRNQLRGVTHEWKKPGNEHFVQNKELQQDKERNMPMQNDLSRTTNFVPHIPPQGDRYFKMDHR